MVNDKTSNATAITGYDITKNSDQRVTLDNNNLRTFDAQSKAVLDTIATNTQDIDVNTDTLETKVEATNTKLDTLIDHSDGVETILTALDTAQDLTNSTLADTNSKIDAMRASDTLTTVKDTVALVTQNLTDGSAKAKVMGADASNGQFQLRTDGDGHLQVDCLTSGLPTGGATSANQTTINTSIGTTNSKLDTLETSNQLINTTTSSRLATVNTSIGSLTTANHTDLVALEASLTSMEGKQDTIITHLSEIEGATETIETAYGLSKCNINISSDAVGLATSANLTAGTAINKVMGSEDGATTGTQRQLKVNSHGALLNNPGSHTHYIAPTNAFNADNVSFANGFAVGCRARTNIASHSTGTFLNCNTAGSLSVAQKKVYSAETSYISGQAVSGSGNHTGSAVTNNADIEWFLFEHNFSGSDVSYEILESLDNSNFFATGQSFNQAGDPTSAITGINGAQIKAPYFKIKFTNGNGSSRDVTLSYVTIST